MKLLDRIFQEAELRDDPPVLVDVGAAGGVWPLWRGIARYSIGVGFEPDARDAARLEAGGGPFRRWIFCEGLVAPGVDGSGRRDFHLTRGPHCSSLLPPDQEALKAWSFADLFAVEKIVSLPAVSLPAALAAKGLGRVDWLKCDTQGKDLSIFLSLPEAWRSRLLAVDFEPGLIDAYRGEDKLWRTLQAMEAEPFWLCDLELGRGTRGAAALLERACGPRLARRAPQVAPSAPVCANLRYLRDPGAKAGPLDRRGLLLAWVFADLLGQHTHALELAAEGTRRFPGGLFADMERASFDCLRRSILRNLAGKLWRRLTGTRVR